MCPIVGIDQCVVLTTIVKTILRPLKPTVQIAITIIPARQALIIMQAVEVVDLIVRVLRQVEDVHQEDKNSYTIYQKRNFKIVQL